MEHGDRIRRDEADRRPEVGGVVTSVIMELLVYPVIYEFPKQKGLDRSEARTSLEATSTPLPGETE